MSKLARRFTIICLICAIFAMLMAAAVADAGRQTSQWRGGTIKPCVFRFGTHCRFHR